jgi:hypothetical protein
VALGHWRQVNQGSLRVNSRKPRHSAGITLSIEGFVWIGWFLFLFLVLDFLVFKIILLQIPKLKFVSSILKFRF